MMLTLGEKTPVMVRPVGYGLERVTCECGNYEEIRSGWKQVRCPECDNWLVSDALVAV